ncbi:MAG: hypothetical protein K0R91_663 [Nitrososphaeraceae archaeon]|jgi:hypothetical protein|nr:hypothetical protein [Nitrososphaeraceae archaeon]
MENQKHRPLGVTIIAILTAIGGIVFLVSGISGIVAGGVSVGIGIIFLILGIAYLVITYGLWKGKRWAWTVTLILSVIGIILAIASIAVGNVGAIVSIIIHGVVIYYLYRPNVKAFFGKQSSALV